MRKRDGGGSQQDTDTEKKRCPCEELSHFKIECGDATYTAVKINKQDVNQVSIFIKIHFRIKCRLSEGELPCIEVITLERDKQNVLGFETSKGPGATDESYDPKTATMEGKNCNGADNTPKNDPIQFHYTATFDRGASADNMRLFLVIPENCEKKEPVWKFAVKYSTKPGLDPHASITATVEGKPVTAEEIKKLKKAKILK